MTNDIIIERSKEGLCPICKKPVAEDYDEVEYKGVHIKVCTMHTKKEKSK